jgi:hypothetical protein
MVSKQRIWQGFGSILCLAMTWKLTLSIEGTEFSGGRVTGLLLNMADVGILLFAASLITSFWLRRTSAIAGLGASILSLPLCLLLLAPGPFRRFAGGEWSVPLHSSFVWNKWTIAWIVLLVLTAIVCLTNLRRPKSQLG